MSAVRRIVKQALPDSPHLEDIVLTASELAANVILHANTSFTVRLTTDEHKVRIEVSDGSSIIPSLEDMTDTSRGLRLVEAASERWGIEATENGKTVWAEFLLA